MNTENTTPALAIASSADNVAAIVRNTPASYSKNQMSHDNCLKACQELLETIRAKGMSDELDRKAAAYIEKTRRTVKAMFDQRAPVTKLFDQVRKEFTNLENEIDPGKQGTAPFQLQQLRNQYAAKKREEEEARQRAEQAKRAKELAIKEYRSECEDDFKAQFNNLVISNINQLTQLNASVTLENYQAVVDTVTGFPSELPDGWCPPSSVRLSTLLTPEQSHAIREEVITSLIPSFRVQYKTEIGDWRQEILDRLPSKKTELERAAQADAAEAARIQAQIKAREASEAARKEAERIAREKDEAKKLEVRKANAEASNLFGMAMRTAPSYQPKTKVTKKIRILNPDGYMKIVALWWAKEGCNLSDEDLAKTFKKQISFCEKFANKQGEFIKDPSIEYVDDVKAQ